jgi:hypothetical protein
VLNNPARNALIGLHAKIAQGALNISRSDGVIEFVTLFVQHQQRPHVRGDNPLHLVENRAQNRVQVET